MRRFAQLLIALLAASSVQAQVYKCIDSAGRVVYSQNPCPANTTPGTISRHLGAAPASSPAAASSDPASAEKAGKEGAAKGAAPKTPADQEQAFRKRLLDRDKVDKEVEQKLAEAKRKEDNCRNARERLAQYEIGGRIARIDAQGERYYEGDAQIEQEKARARSDVAQYCN